MYEEAGDWCILGLSPGLLSRSWIWILCWVCMQAQTLEAQLHQGRNTAASQTPSPTPAAPHAASSMHPKAACIEKQQAGSC